MPDEILNVPSVDPALESFQALSATCESRLRKRRKAFDMMGFLRLGVIIDRVQHQVLNRSIPFSKAEDVINQVMAKIAEKEAAYEEDLAPPS